MGIAFAILGILVVGAVVGSAINFGSVFLGIPIVFLFIGAVIGKEQMERQQRILRLKRFRREAYWLSGRPPQRRNYSCVSEM